MDRKGLVDLIKLLDDAVKKKDYQQSFRLTRMLHGIPVDFLILAFRDFVDEQISKQEATQTKNAQEEKKERDVPVKSEKVENTSFSPIVADAFMSKFCCQQWICIR
jgi:hypothetical protein